MRQKIEEEILEQFYEYPRKKFTVRELSNLIRVPRATVHKKLIDLKNKGLISKENEIEDSLLFRTKKINYYIERIVESGVVDEIINKLNPSCVILFGSIRKGDSVKESDIDLFVESFVKKKINLGKFERRMGHKIQLFVESDIKKLQDNLFNNVINGIKLFGSFKVK